MDRNFRDVSLNYKEVLSLSARRAWIEMALLEVIPLGDPVALRKESVDRNRQNYECFEWIKGRSPQGERG